LPAASAALAAARTVPISRSTGPLEPVGSPGFLPADSSGKALNLNFESGTLEGWKAEGRAFGGQPVKKGDNKGKSKGKKGPPRSGKFWIGHAAPVDAQGSLTSERFMATHPYVSYLIAGGTSPKTRVEIVTADDNRVFHSASNKGGLMHPIIVDVKAIVGRPIFIRLIDDDPKAALLFDDFRLHEASPKFPP